MSYVLSIRATQSIARSRIDDAIHANSAWAWNGNDQLLWGLPEAEASAYLNYENGELWTDSVPSNSAASDSFSEALQQLAVALDADLIGEEGESLLQEVDGGSKALGLVAIILIVPLGILLLPVFAVFLLLRLPWLMWQIFHPKEPEA